MSLASNISTALTRVATEFKAIRTLISGSATGDISGLITSDKTSLVAAINEVQTEAGGAPPDASTTVKGIVELATNAETQTGTDTVRATTPAGVAAAIAGKADTASLAAVATSGSASDLTGTLPTAVLPPLAVNDTFTPATQAAMLALTAQRGDIAIRQDNGKTYVLSTDSPGTLADWKEITAAGAVSSVNGETGVVSLSPADVGTYSTAEIGDPTTDFAAGFVAALA
jgi:hypothetical protein